MSLTRYLFKPRRHSTAPTPETGVRGHHGGVLPLDRLRVEVQGPADAPAVAVLGGISASGHVAAHAGDTSPGWWEEAVGPGRAIDTTQVRVVSIDWITVDGHPVDTHDQARALAAALDRLRIAQLHTLVGASYGGMVGLAFAARFPERLGQLVVLNAAHESHPMATALRTIQRDIVRLGVSSGRANEAVAIARALAITTYRTPAEFAARFDNTPVSGTGRTQFPVEAYLRYGGTRFAIRCAAERYLALSESIDLHRVDPTTITTPTILFAVDGDQIVPLWQARELAAQLPAVQRVVEITSQFGHDAFLKEVDAIVALLTDALTGEVARVA